MPITFIIIKHYASCGSAPINYNPVWNFKRIIFVQPLYKIFIAVVFAVIKIVYIFIQALKIHFT